MRNGILFILSLSFCLSSLAQEKKESKGYIRIGPQIGLMLNAQASPQTHLVDVFTSSRLVSFNFEGGIGFYFNESNRLELNGSVGFFGLRDKKFKNEVLARSDNYFLYHDFELDETNSTGNLLRNFTLVIDYVHDFTIKKWKISPNFGAGIRQINHRNYEYILREPSSNQFVEYALTSNTKPNFFYRIGLRFYHERWLNTEWYLNLSGGQINYDYSIQETNPFPNNTPFDVKYGGHLLVISAGIKLKALFSEFGTE